MESPSIRYAHNGDVSIAYTTIGDGPHEMIFVSGFVSHLEVGMELSHAQRFWERLGSFCRVICFDKRGLGLSDRGAGSYTVEAVAEDMVAVLDAAGVERAAVFGVSEGGCAATMFAATHPDRTSALVEYGTYARMVAADDYPQGLPLELMRRFNRSMIENWAAPDFLKVWAPSWADDHEAQEWWAKLLRSGTSPAGVREIEAMYESLDVRPLLPLVQVPSLILWRVDDILVPARLSRDVAAGIPGSRAVELPGSDHLFLAGDQEALLGEVEEFLTGSRSGPPAQRVLATVLFTDIVGSTEQAAALGDARWREVLAQHDRIARREVESQRGRLIKSTGDGILATFDGPARAIQAARSFAKAVGQLGIEVRAGVHAGECELIGEDVGGIAVHIGARVGAKAGPGEVLVSRTVRDLVVGSGLEFDDRGTQALKGVPDQWQLFAAR